MPPPPISTGVLIRTHDVARVPINSPSVWVTASARRSRALVAAEAAPSVTLHLMSNSAQATGHTPDQSMKPMRVGGHE